MAEAQKNINETYEANPGTKQFNLGTSFEAYAKTKGLSEKGIQMARAEIEDRFAKFNAEGMDDRRFRNLRGTIDGMINNEIGKAQSLLASRSEALAGTSLKPAPAGQQFAYNNPQENQVTPPQAPNKPTFSGLMNAKETTKDANSNRGNVINAALKAAGA